MPKAKLEYTNIRNYKWYMHHEKWLEIYVISVTLLSTKELPWVFFKHALQNNTLGPLIMWCFCHHTVITDGMECENICKCNFLVEWCSYLVSLKSVHWFFNSWRDNIQVIWAEGIKPICCYTNVLSCMSGSIIILLYYSVNNVLRTLK